MDAAAEFAPETPPADIGRCAKFHDSNADTSNISFRRLFPTTSSGIVTVQFDMRLKQTSAAFFVRVSNNTTFTNLSSSACNLIFEGNTVWLPGGGGATEISYLHQWSTPAYTMTGATYAADTWHTVQIVLNVGAKTWSVNFGPKGGTLDPILVDAEWVWKGGTDPHD